MTVGGLFSSIWSSIVNTQISTILIVIAGIYILFKITNWKGWDNWNDRLNKILYEDKLSEEERNKRNRERFIKWLIIWIVILIILVVLIRWDLSK